MVQFNFNDVPTYGQAPVLALLRATTGVDPTNFPKLNHYLQSWMVAEPDMVLVYRKRTGKKGPHSCTLQGHDHRCRRAGVVCSIGDPV